jgi:hypothetical protein
MADSVAGQLTESRMSERTFLYDGSSVSSDVAALRKLSRRQQIFFVCACARSVMGIWRKCCPYDTRPLDAIEITERSFRSLATVPLAGVIHAGGLATVPFDSAVRDGVLDATADLHVHRPVAVGTAAAAHAADSASCAVGVAVSYAARATRAAAHSAALAALRAVEATSADAVASATDADLATGGVGYAAIARKWEWIHRLYIAAYRDGCTFPYEWKTPSVTELVRTMIETGDLGAMPILADALEDAGCDDGVLLRHAREDDDRWRLSDWLLAWAYPGR